MNEIPSPESGESNRSERRKEISVLAREMSEKGETFSYSEIDPAEYAKMKATDEEYPGFSTPTDELIERFKKEGMKVALGDDPESGNVFIVPAQGNVTAEDMCLAPRKLKIVEEMSERLKKLVMLDLVFYNEFKKSK